MEDMTMAKKSKNHHLEQRGDNWSFVTMVNGKRVKKALSTSVTEARTLRDQYLKEIAVYGEIVSLKPALESGDDEILFGEVAEKWAKITSKQVKSSTWKDYKGAMNYYLLPYFGDTPIDQVTFLMVEEFVAELPCSSKRANNVLVPLRSLMRFAYRAELIPKNPMDLVDNQKTDKADIDPLSMDEVNRFLEVIDPFYKPFFIVAFFTGMRFGEMSGLKWKNVSFGKKIIQVKVTRVRGEEGHPKTNGSVRDIKMLPPVIEALKEQNRATADKSEYVFLNKNDRPVLPASINFLFWKPALEKAGLKPRSLYHTRHTFATLMLDSGEVPGWVQKMMGHSSLKMILERYYSHIKNYERDDGTAFMERVYSPTMKNTISR
jgi:integrase